MIVTPHSADFAALLCASHRRLTGHDLVDPALPPSDAARWLYDAAPFCVLAHDTQADPCFIYANLAAQTCFEYDWDEFIGLPSRLSAEAPNRDERDRLLADVARQGYASGYRGLRIAKSGRRFWIEDVTVWNLVDAAGLRLGQAATYRRITPA
ncbi:MEKHLA domain-containing protein [Jeongeupia naejangsanensis]|uniref:MEKHLA domain-containing protein n=1 Tax=Jeongeupia naejangsanensis TaxID=613195 RepID=A0ABS2BQM0_9NEIS|nr:MEKHLA domain-containing protein [Jeongeupia naejangsanensis]MBM3117064.1 MEKHLA domain-containing protein [Jeongeupia naejangsanensis]